MTDFSDAIWSMPLTGIGVLYHRFYCQGLKDAGDNRALIVEEILFSRNFTAEKAEKIKQIIER